MRNILDSVDAVLFDIGSTLVMGPLTSPNKEVVKHFGLPGEMAKKVGRLIMCTDFQGPAQVCQVLNTCGVPTNKDDCAFVSKLWQEQEVAPKPIAGGLEMVQFFREAGKKIGLLSDIWVPYYRAFTRACPEISDLAEVKQLSFKTQMKKPEAAFFRSAIEALKVAAERILMVGDTYENDIAPAIEQRMRTGWILARPERETAAIVGVIQGHLTKPDITVASILELKSTVTKERSVACQDR
jgi:HAD superfamily hydrolase (TIGR01549 family)